MTWAVHAGDAIDVLRTMPAESVHCCITSPPYWGLRDYGVDGQIGLEASLAEFIARLVAVFAEVRRVLRSDGTLWVNMGDAYITKQSGTVGRRSQMQGRRNAAASRAGGDAVTRGVSASGLKYKDLIGQPWRLAFALQDAGWYLRSDIIWHKPTAMPETVTDRPSRAHEYLFLLARSPTYHYDAAAIKTLCSPKTRTVRTSPVKGDGTGSTGEKMNAWMAKNGGRYHPEKANKRTVWKVASRPFKGAHFATFPVALVEPCVLAGCPLGGVVLDPFAGSGSTGVAAVKHSRSFVGIELNPEYATMARHRVATSDPIGAQQQLFA